MKKNFILQITFTLLFSIFYSNAEIKGTSNLGGDKDLQRNTKVKLSEKAAADQKKTTSKIVDTANKKPTTLQAKSVDTVQVDLQQANKKVEIRKKIEPTFRDVEYGPYERNKLDFWKAESKTPTPLVFYIHGGGWGGGSKETNDGPYLNLLKQGVSYVSINYRLARGENVLPCSLHDAARALQFVRSKAKEWNIDKVRIIVSGGSAGGCSSLWLACHDDLANSKSDDPVERESTRLLAAAVISAQTTIDPILLKERIGTAATSHSMIWASVGAKSEKDLFDNWDNYKALSLECSPLTHLSQDDPPIYMSYSDNRPMPITKNGIHHAEFGRILKVVSDSIGHKCTFVVQGADIRQEKIDAFMLRSFEEAKQK